MPDIYTYFGFIFSFFSQEHEPIHVHVEHQDRMWVRCTDIKTKLK